MSNAVSVNFRKDNDNKKKKFGFIKRVDKC